MNVPTPPPRPAYTLPPGAPPPPAVPPAVPAPAVGVPESVIHSREELQQLQGDAEQLLGAEGPHFELAWCDPRHAGACLQGIVDTVRWLLGERPISPISEEPREEPALPTVREVGRETIRAEDAVNGLAWRHLPEWYSAGVLRTLEWATKRRPPRPRPVAAL
ncbi:hypothetical protein ACIGZJ_36180 [Kitasatospora sp. NPDC052868]|uniref:hypothetical protein n=1 Tax=Kitasatospora sp. NPDC052868 TaxID=3364060 RepID=UPI0037C609F5